MNRGDVIKRVAHELKEELAQAKLDAVEAVEQARAAFRERVAWFVQERHAVVLRDVLDATGGNHERVVVDVKYELHDDELMEPSRQCLAVVRDGEEYDCSFRLVVPVCLATEDDLDQLREEWVAAKLAQRRLDAASEKMPELRAAAWQQVVGAVLDETEEGQAVQAALRSLRARIKGDGWERLGELCSTGGSDDETGSAG